jgi:L-fuculose-phosphate aldolase
MLETICDTLVEAYRRNWITSRDGNVSIRHHDRDHFYITPSGVRKQTLQPDQFKKIGLGSSIYSKYCVELPYSDISAKLKPSGELPLHFGLQSTISDAFPELNRYTKVAPNVGDVPPISQELADRCHENLKLDKGGNIAYDIVGIKGHGVVAIDTSPWRAFEHIERLEHICQIVLASGKY